MKQWLVRRGLLAALPLAAVAIAFVACSSESVSPPGGTGQPSKAEAAQAQADEIAATPVARGHLARVAQFTRIVKVAKKDSDAIASSGRALAKGIGAGALQASAHQAPPQDFETQLQPVVTPGDAERFVKRNDRVRAQVSDKLKRDAVRPATVDLPQTAEGFVRIQADGGKAGVEFAVKGSKAGIALEAADGLVNFPGAAPGGGDLVLRVGKETVEDFVVLETKPEHAFVDYRVKVGEIAGLRFYDDTVEFLSASGNPEVRVSPPYLVDSDGVTHHAKLELPDCAFDTSPAAPWDRPVTAPGASECTLRVSWDNANVAYPAILDPVWAAGGTLAKARYRNAAATLSNGKVITCGGLDINSDPLDSCELYSPGTNTWASGPKMTSTRSIFTLIPVGTDVLAVGDASNATSELCNCTAVTPAWTATATNFSGGSLYLGSIEPTLTADGAYVVIVDQNGKPFRYQVSAKAWTVGTQNGVYRNYYSVVAVPSGTAVMRCDGADNTNVGLKTCEKYTPSTDTWVMPGAGGAIANTNAARLYAAWAKIDATHVMLYGGQNAAGASITSAEIYNSGTNAWLDVGAIPASFSEGGMHNTSALLGSPAKVVSISYYYLTVYDPVTVTWTQITNNYEGGNYFSLIYNGEAGIASAGSKVIVVPVTPNGSFTAQSACKLFDFVPQGGFCGQTSECKPGLFCVYDDKYYVDGQSVCCDTTCTDECSSCRSANKETKTLEGTCGPRDHTQSAAYTKCPSEAQSTCGNVGGYCDGQGACAKWDATTACVNTSCVDSDTQNNTQLCDGKGKCGAASTTDCTGGYACLSSFGFNRCVNYCQDDSWCQSSYYCNFWGTYPYACAPKKSDGQSCSDGYSDTECSNGHCSSGVCCDTACTDTCKSCLNSDTGQTTGKCSNVPASAGSQYRWCYDSGSTSCGTTGKCDGAGACQLYASGTVCADVGSCASETVRYVPDTCDGSGTCTDKGTQNCTTGYSCQNGVCNTQCTSDANCASAYYCDIPNQTCVLDKKVSQPCLRDAACEGNANCVEIDPVTKLGVCCNSACAGDCQSCLTVNTGLGDGVCGNVFDDRDPKNKCAQGAAYPNSCAAPGLCDGNGSCRPYAKVGVECDTDVCTDSTLTTYECNGAGTCKAKATQCYPFKCDTGNNVCRVACSSDSECVTGSCNLLTGSCVGQLQNGQACTRGAQCGSGFCANINEGALQGDTTVNPGGGFGGGGAGGTAGAGSGGGGTGGTAGAGSGGGGAGGSAGTDPGADLPGVCCDTACQGTCSGCKASIKGFGSDGVCEFVKNNTDPANDCEKATNDACGLDGQCNGAGACRLAPSGTACGASSCQGNSVLGQSCDGAGDCINNQGGVDCAPYLCRDVKGAFQCTNPCAEDNDCQDGYYCSDSACKKKLTNSKACTDGTICASGYCVDGVCCDTSCNGQCEACDAAGNEGTCTPVKGDPHGMRAACDHAGDECGGQCDGVNSSTCKYAANGTTCGTTTCDNGLAKSSACNGQGECRANKDTECSPYQCGPDDTCLSRCNTSDDCSQGYACDATTQRCLPSAVAATCSDDRLTSKGQNGNDTPCKPFLCVPASGTCAVSCAFTTDCAPDFVCEPSTKTCLPAPTGGGTDDGGSCACRAAGATPTRSSYLALAALGVALTGLRRRRRSRRVSRPTGKPLGYATVSHPHE